MGPQNTELPPVLGEQTSSDLVNSFFRSLRLERMFIEMSTLTFGIAQLPLQHPPFLTIVSDEFSSAEEIADLNRIEQVPMRRERFLQGKPPRWRF